MRFFRLVSASLLGLLCFVCTDIASAEGPKQRFVVLIDEHVDDAKSPSHMAESALTKALLGAGATLIDEAQSRKIRSVTDAGTLIEGAVPDVITSLDADLIVAGQAFLQETKQDLLGDAWVSYHASVHVVLKRVDNGQVVGVYDGEADGLGRSAAQSRGQALTRAIEPVSKSLIAGIASQNEQRIEITVEGIPNVTAGERVMETLRSLDGLSGVGEVRALQAGRGLTKVEVRSAGAGPRAGPGVGCGCGLRT